MTRMTWLWIAIGAAVISATTLRHPSRARDGDDASCDAVCQVKQRGWQVTDPGPPVWLRSPEGWARLDIAIAEPGQAPKGDAIPWEKTRLASRKGPFGALGDCDRKAEANGQIGSIIGVDCAAPPGPDGPRKGAIFGVATPAGLQVIGLVLPAKWEYNYSPLHWLASQPGDGRTEARAARAAIALVTGRAYYEKADAGAQSPAIESVRHNWNRHLTTCCGVVDDGYDFILFKNGETWRNPGLGPRDIDAARFQEARWNDVGTWRQQADGILITLNGSKPFLLSLKNFERYEPATGASQRVEGLWKWTHDIFVNRTYYESTKLLRLHADGTFERDGLATTNAGGGSVAALVLRKKRLQGGDGGHLSGHYRIDGYTLNLDYDDGTKVSDLFYWAGGSGDSRYGMFLINGEYWLGGLVR